MLVAAGVAILVLSGCTPDEPEAPDFPTAGALTAADLPDGDWTGPYEDWSKASVERRAMECPFLSALWEPLETPVKDATAAWADGDTVVWSVASEFAHPEDAQSTMDLMRQAERCVRTTPDPEYDFTMEDDGTTIVTREHISDDGLEYVSEFAAREERTTVVGVMVGYPAAEPPDFTAESLLDRAVEVSADLEPVD